MACRTPAIATPAGAAPELITEGGGVLVPPEDPDAFAAAIEQVCGLSDPEWRAMSEQVRAVSTSHTWERFMPLFEAASSSLSSVRLSCGNAGATRLGSLGRLD